MINIGSYFCPFSKKFHAIQDFKNITTSSNRKTFLLKVGIVALSIFVGLLTLSFGGFAVFRALVGRCKKIEPSTLTPDNPATKTDQIARTSLLDTETPPPLPHFPESPPSTKEEYIPTVSEDEKENVLESLNDIWETEEDEEIEEETDDAIEDKQHDTPDYIQDKNLDNEASIPHVTTAENETNDLDETMASLLSADDVLQNIDKEENLPRILADAPDVKDEMDGYEFIQLLGEIQYHLDIEHHNEGVEFYVLEEHYIQAFLNIAKLSNIDNALLSENTEIQIKAEANDDEEKIQFAEKTVSFNDIELMKLMLKKKKGRNALSNPEVWEAIKTYVHNQKSHIDESFPDLGLGARLILLLPKTNLINESVLKKRIEFLKLYIEYAAIARRFASIKQNYDDQEPHVANKIRLEDVTLTGATPSLIQKLDEILNTENTYLTSIESLTKGWNANESGEDISFFQRLRKEGVITLEELDLLDNQWNEMIESSQSMIDGLKGETVENKIYNLINQTNALNMNAYMERIAFLVAKHELMSTIWKKVNSEPKLKTLLYYLKVRCGGRNVEDLLITPVQRGPRYKLLLENVIQEGKRAGLCQPAIEALENNLRNLNEQMQFLNSLLTSQRCLRVSPEKNDLVDL